MLTKSGEFFVPDQSTPYEIRVNLERYLFALQFCEDKIVLDAGCGTGLGTYLYSLVAKRVIAVDHNEDALSYAKRFPGEYPKVHFIKADLEKDLLPDHEICVALEIIEHLEHPDFFLSQLKSKELVFSIPLNSLSISSWHKYDFKTIKDIKEIIERYYKVENYYLQDNIWVCGRGNKL